MSLQEMTCLLSLLHRRPRDVIIVDPFFWGGFRVTLLSLGDGVVGVDTCESLSRLFIQLVLERR